MRKESGCKKFHRKLLVVAGAVILIAGILAAVVIYFRAGAKSAALLSLTDLLEEDPVGFAVEVSASAGEREYALNAEVRIGSAEGEDLTVITWNGLSLYCTDNLVFLEDGTAYLLTEDAGTADSESLTGEEGEEDLPVTGSSVVPDYSLLLSLIKTYYVDVDIDQSETDGARVYSISLDSDSCSELLTLLLPSAAEYISETGTTTIDLYVGDGAAESIVIRSSAAPAGDDGDAELQLEARIAIMDGETSVFTVPEAVLSAMGNADRDDLIVLTDDLLELLAAWDAWNEQEEFGAAISLDADLGPISLSPEATWIHTVEDDAGIDRITIGDVTFVYSEENEEEPEDELSREEETAANMMVLPELAYEIFLRGGISFTEEGESMVCSVSLTSQQMESIVTALIPDAAQLEIRYGDGFFEVVVTDGEFDSLSLECSGGITVLLLEVPISLQAQIQLLDMDPAGYLSD